MEQGLRQTEWQMVWPGSARCWSHLGCPRFAQPTGSDLDVLCGLLEVQVVHQLQEKLKASSPSRSHLHYSCRTPAFLSQTPYQAQNVASSQERQNQTKPCFTHRQDACESFTKLRTGQAFGIRLIAPQPSNKAKLFHAWSVRRTCDASSASMPTFPLYRSGIKTR